MHEAPEGPAQRDEDREPQQRREQHVIRQAEMDHGKSRHRNRQPHHAENVDERIKKKSAVAPGHDEIFDHRAGQDEFHQRGDAERKAPPIALGHVGAHEIVPAEPVKVGGDAPVRAAGLDRPACHRPVGRQRGGETSPCTFQAFWNRAISRMKRRCWCSGSDRLVACHLHETTLAHERLRHASDLSAGSLGNMAWSIKRAGRRRPAACRMPPVSSWRKTQNRPFRRAAGCASLAAASAVELAGILRYTGRSH